MTIGSKRIAATDIEDFEDDEKRKKNRKRQCSGMRDCVSVRLNGKEKQNVKKRVMHDTLAYAYKKFLVFMPDKAVCFSKFCNMRPKEVQLFYKANLRSCLCMYCTNMQFLIQALFPYFKEPKYDLLGVMLKVSCFPNDFTCVSGSCVKCSDFMSVIKALLIDSCSESQLKFTQWTKNGNFHEKKE